MAEANKQISADAVLTLGETAAALGMDPKRVRQAIRQNELPAHRLGKATWRIIWADVLMWVRKNRVHLDGSSSTDSARQRAAEILQSVNLGGKS